MADPTHTPKRDAPSETLLSWDEARDTLPLIQKIRPFTMVPHESLLDLSRIVRAVLTYRIPGNLVECGTWRGGSSFLMAEVLKHSGADDRKVWLFDSFEGLPAPKEIDGKKAVDYVSDPEGPWYYNNCAASIEEVRDTAGNLGLTPYTEMVKGWFNETLEPARNRIGPISVLRIDGDWYDSVLCCLEALYDQVVDGGFVIFDDYYAFDGCAIAVHEFLGKRGLAHRLEAVVGKWDGGNGAPYCQSALFRKGHGTWQWLQQVQETVLDIAKVVPAEEAFILADNGELGEEIAAGRRPVPFTQKDGQYWGPPADGPGAVMEMQALQQAGLNFMAVAWPARWWLDYYAELGAYLESNGRRILENDRLVVFDLRPSPR